MSEAVRVGLFAAAQATYKVPTFGAENQQLQLNGYLITAVDTWVYNQDQVYTMAL